MRQWVFLALDNPIFQKLVCSFPECSPLPPHTFFSSDYPFKSGVMYILKPKMFYPMNLGPK